MHYKETLMKGLSNFSSFALFVDNISKFHFHFLQWERVNKFKITGGTGTRLQSGEKGKTHNDISFKLQLGSFPR